MIQEFSFGNFRSFKDIETLDLKAAALKPSKKSLNITNLTKMSEQDSILKSKVIYGANGSGKSNIVLALKNFRDFIFKSVQEDFFEIWDPNLLVNFTFESPIYFQIVFYIDDKRYRYGFTYNVKKILSEWLFCKSNKREEPYFIREDGYIKELNHASFPEGSKIYSIYEDFKNENEEALKGNRLFLSNISSFGFAKISQSILKYIDSIQIAKGLKGEIDFSDVKNKLRSNKELFIFANKILSLADTGNKEIKFLNSSFEEIEEYDNVHNDNSFLMTLKNKFGSTGEIMDTVRMPFDNTESEGTKKLFELSPLIFESLQKGTPLIIDEFDARLHPLLSKKLIELYNSEANKHAQLIFVTHDTNLLSNQIFRRDQIDFVEKDKFGASHIYSLSDIKGVRNTASFEDDYIAGKYGAIPFLGDFNKLLKDFSDEEE